MSELTLFWDMMSQNSQSIWHSNVEISRSHFKLQYQVASTTTSTSFITTAQPPTAVIDINNPMHHPTATSLQQHPYCLPQQPHGRQWQQDGRVEGEWGEWVEGERETGKVTTMQCATHTLHHLFLSLHVFWWCSMQPTCHVSFFFPSMLFVVTTCNPHATSSISFYFYSYIYS